MEKFDKNEQKKETADIDPLFAKLEVIGFGDKNEEIKRLLQKP